MARRKSPWNGLKTCLLILILLLFFTGLPIVTWLLTASLAFVIQHTSIISLTTIVALLLAVLFRLQFVVTVPEKTLGVLVDRSGEFKALLPPAKYWMWPRSERIKAYLSLEPTSTQMSLLKLRASDGEIPAQVVIIVWRVRADMAELLLGESGPEVERMAMKSHSRREQYVRGAVALILRQLIQQRTVRQAEADLADTQTRPLQTVAIKLLNPYLLSVGLQVDQLEFVGVPPAAGQAAAAPSQSANEAQKLLAEVQRKLKQILQPTTQALTPQGVAQYAWQAHHLTSQVRGDINEITDALNRYAAAVSDTFGPLYRQAKPLPDLSQMDRARQESFARLTQLHLDVGALGQKLIELDQQARRLPQAPFDLTPAECSQLLELLEAIERKKIKLDGLV